MGDLPHLSLTTAANGLLALDRLIKALKQVSRTGWLDRGIDPAMTESVADHSLGVALLAWTSAIERRAAGADLDPSRVLALSLLHDLAEAETGDWPPYDPAAVPDPADATARQAFLDRRHERAGARHSAKRSAEQAAMNRLLGALPDATRAELSAVWAELQAETSNEARFVKQVDRLETFLQSRHYLQADPGLAIASFRQEAIETIDDPLLAAIRDAALTGASP